MTQLGVGSPVTSSGASTAAIGVGWAPPPGPVVLSALLGLAASVSAIGSLFFPSLLHGVPVTDGNVRGTALVILALGLPILVAGALTARGGSARGLVLWLAGTAYLTYQGVLFCFATPLNALFLPYVATLGLGVWLLLQLVPLTAAPHVTCQVATDAPMRSSAVVLGVFATLNGLAWLARVLPTTWTGDQPEALAGSGLTTSAVWVQDLAFWVPAAIVVSVMCWRRRTRGAVLVAAFLMFYVVESLSVASDQWWGVRADDTHPALASMAAVPGGIVIAVLTAVPLVLLVRRFRVR